MNIQKAQEDWNNNDHIEINAQVTINICKFSYHNIKNKSSFGTNSGFKNIFSGIMLHTNIYKTRIKSLYLQNH